MPPVAETEATTRDDATSFDRERLSLLWYGQSVPWIRATTGLTLPNSEHLRALPGAGSGHLAAISPDLEGVEFDPSRTVVVGGPCIGDCLAFPTLEALYDSVQTALVGQTLGLPVVLYLGDQEEALERDAGLSKWSKLAERIEAWLHVVLSSIGCTDVTIIRTSMETHDLALGRANQACRRVDSAVTDAAFHLGTDVPRAQSERSRSVTGRVIEAHVPSVVSAQSFREGAEPVTHVIIAENIQQAGVVSIARELAAPETRVSFVAHWPAPGLTAGQRMYRARSWEKLPAKEIVTVAAGDIPGLSPVTWDFFANWLDAEKRAALADAASGRH